ncbi:MAG: hypothetical protein V1774_00230 [Candidatus Eisenbacteria bacterium]
MNGMAAKRTAGMQERAGLGRERRSGSRARKGSRALILTGMLLLMLGAQAGCGDDTLVSEWRRAEVAIDAVNGEWEGAITDFEDEQVSVGLMNDQEYLYIGLVVENQNTRSQLLAGGFTIWLDPSGKKEKGIGVRYPLGAAEKDRGRFVRSLLDGGDAQELAQTFGVIGDTMEVMGRGPLSARRMARDAGPVDVAARVDKNMIYYELKVPLGQSDLAAMALGSEPGGILTVGIETQAGALRESFGPGGGRRGPGGEEGQPGGEGDRPGGEGGPPSGGGGRRPGGPPSGGGGRGGPGGSGGGPGPGGMGPGAERGGGEPSPLEIWMKVRLAGPEDVEGD